MDHCLCQCQAGKCKAHLCQQRQRAYLRKNCPAEVDRKLKGVSKALTDSNGRFLNPQHKCSFPWSTYLRDQWYTNPCTSSNSCGKKHIPSSTKNLPSFFKNHPDKTFDEDTSLLHCNQFGHAVWHSDGKEKSSKVTPADNLICQAFKTLKDKQLPVIWVFGHAHKPAQQTRHQFCQELASELGFLYLNMDFQIRHWTDQLFHSASTEEVLILPPTVKRLATMCVQLMGDEELHLNLAGTMELIKLIMVNAWNEAERLANGSQRPPPNGFIIEGFPCSHREAEAFEKSVYPVSLGIYFEGRWWSAEDQKAYLEPELELPTYFRREAPYSEKHVEEMVDLWGERSIKILNMEDIANYEARYIINVIKQKLANPPGKGEDSSVDYAKHAMEQLAEIYKCTDPCCKCAWSEQDHASSQSPGGNFASGASGGSPLVITCPLERPPMPKVEHEKTLGGSKPEVVEAGTIHHHHCHHKHDKEETPPHSVGETIVEELDWTTSGEHTGSTPPVTDTTASSGEGSSTKTSKKSSKKKKKSKKGSKHKTEGGSSEDEGSSASPKSPKKSKGDKKSKKHKSKSPEGESSITTSHKPSKHKKKDNHPPKSSQSSSPAPSTTTEKTKSSNKSTKSKSKKKHKPEEVNQDNLTDNHTKKKTPKRGKSAASSGLSDYSVPSPPRRS